MTPKMYILLSNNQSWPRLTNASNIFCAPHSFISGIFIPQCFELLFDMMSPIITSSNLRQLHIQIQINHLIIESQKMEIQSERRKYFPRSMSVDGRSPQNVIICGQALYSCLIHQSRRLDSKVCSDWSICHHIIQIGLLSQTHYLTRWCMNPADFLNGETCIERLFFFYITNKNKKKSYMHENKTWCSLILIFHSLITG